MRPSSLVKEGTGSVLIETYPYTGDHDPVPCQAWTPPQVDAQGNAPVEPPAPYEERAKAATAGIQEFESRVAEERRRSFEAGLQRGREEGRAAEQEAQRAVESQEAQHRAGQLAKLMAEFAAERARHLERVEHEAVKLALAIAARILRREAQTDPLMLTGAVRVALGQLGASTRVRLRVPSPDADLWREAVALLPDRRHVLEVIPEEGMHVGDCLLETELGSADLGLRAQLGEIESGFLDGLSTRPAQTVRRDQP